MSLSPLKNESSIDGASMTVNSESSSPSSPFMWSCPSPAKGQSRVKIPFSWEQEPGVPKHKIHSVRTNMTKSLSSPILNNQHHHRHHHHLRPPPMLVSKPSEPKQKKKVESDPFVAAMVECTKHEKSKGRSKNRAKSIFSWMRSCSTSDIEVSVPRSKSSRSNQVLDIDSTTTISKENLKQYGSIKQFGKENRQQQPNELVEWVSCSDIELYHTLLEEDV